MSAAADWIKNIRVSDVDHKIFKDVIKIAADVDVKPMLDGQIIIISDINRVTITLETSGGEKKTVKAIAKLEPPPGPGREMAIKFNAFTTEVLMYADIIKKMEGLLTGVGDKNSPWPDCYYSADNKFLFEDLCEKGYRIVPTYKFLDFNHTMMVMKALGKFHGLSMVLKENGQLDVSKFPVPLFATKDPIVDKMQQTLMQSMGHYIKNNWDAEWSPIIDRLLKCYENAGEKIHELWNSTKGKWDVLNHGDFTMRNMLFHYPEESSTPDGVKFIDFQMCHYSNLALDLGIILYSSLMPQTRDDNMTEFLTAYAESMSKVCQQNCFTGPVPTLQDVKSALKSLDYLTASIALLQLPMFILTESEDMQGKTEEFIQEIAGESTSPKPPGQFLNLSHPGVDAVLKSELKRCIKENIF